MIICKTFAELRSARETLQSPIGFVATMGALHAGHESLVARARTECASVVASVYVNPLQFGPNEDFAKYPRTFDADSALLSRHRVDVLFAPSDAEMDPPGSQVVVDPGPLGDLLEGASRPGHFRGVATVVMKMFNIVAPDRAYFGCKDAQQLAVVRRMAAELAAPVEIIACATVREPDGLALSSRNKYLTESERRDAVKLSLSLSLLVDAVEHGATDFLAVARAASAELPPLVIDYLAVVDPEHFVPLESLTKASRLLAVGAAYCGATRLIDNMEIKVPAMPPAEQRVPL